MSRIVSITAPTAATVTRMDVAVGATVGAFVGRSHQIMGLANQPGGKQLLIGKVVAELAEIAVALIQGILYPAFEAV